MPLPRQQLAGYGWSLAVGDVAGADGFADIVVGAPFVNSDTGRLQMGKVYVYDGHGGCLVTTLEWNGADDAGLVHFGKSVAIGDFNGDGIPDILVGAPDDDVTFADDGLRYENVGRVFVFFGPFSATQPVRTADFIIDKPGAHVAGAQFGYSIAIGKAHPAGDNEQEVLIGAPQEQVGVNPALGQAFVVKYNGGSPTSLILGPAALQDNVRFGEAVAIGPLSGAVDGSSEFVVGAPGQNAGVQSQVGAVYVWSYADAMGSSAATTIVQKPLNATYAAFLTLFFGAVGISPDTNSYFGASLAVGDINNDGVTELVIGAPNEGLVVTKSGLGTVWTFAGNALGAGPLFGYLSPNAAAQSGMQFGTSLAIGDIDKDGTKDIIIGSPFEQVTVGPTPYDTAGRVFLVRSNMGFTIDGTYLTGAFVEAFTGPYDLTNIVGVVNMTGLHNHEADGRFGWAVASGNINNSGIDDIAATGIRLDVPADPNGVNTGRVFLFIEDAQPAAPAIVAPANGSTVTTKLNVTLSAGPFVDNDVADCTGTPVWSDQHSATQWRIATAASADCSVGTVQDTTVVRPNALTGLTIPNLFTLSPLFNFGGTVYWCVRFKDDVSGTTTVPGEVWSPWSTASFTIGVPDLTVTAVADPNTTSPYAAPSFSLAARPPVPPVLPNLDTVDFKTLSCIDSRTVNITITNSGTAEAPVTSVSLLTGAPTYVLSGIFESDCTTAIPTPFTLAAGESFCASVLFTSGAPATFTDTLRVTYDDPINYDVALTGASAAPVANITPLTPAAYTTEDLGTFVIGDPGVTRTVTISETGGLAPLKVDAVTLTLAPGTTSANFTWAWTDTGDQTLPRYVPAGGSLSITVTFTPAVGAGCGLKQATFEVTTNSGCVPTTEGIIYTATVTGPDLLGSWVRFSSTLASDGGETVRGVLRVQNGGTAIDPTKLPITVKFYLSSDTFFTPSVDTFLYDYSLNYAFGAGEVKHLAFTWKFDAVMDGQYIIAVIDSENVILECSEYPVVPEPVPGYTPYPLAGYESNNVVIPVKGGVAYSIYPGGF